jgi:hypothetical protein
MIVKGTAVVGAQTVLRQQGVINLPQHIDHRVAGGKNMVADRNSGHHHLLEKIGLANNFWPK